MGDLSEEELEFWPRAIGEDSRGDESRALVRAIAEIRHHRAAQTANSERVRSVVREAIRIPGCEQFEGVFIPHRDIDAIADRVAAQLTAPTEGGPGWCAGIEASVRWLEAMGRLPRDLWQPAYFAAVDEAILHLRAMLARGTERVTAPVAEGVL